MIPDTGTAKSRYTHLTPASGLAQDPNGFWHGNLQLLRPTGTDFPSGQSGTVCQYLSDMDQSELASRAEDWIQYWHAPAGSPDRERYADATDLYELQYHDPEALWLLILAIHHRDQSFTIQEVLSAGPVEDLLAKHGDAFINRVEAEARKDPQCAKLLGGVWKNSMSEGVWKRLQAAWDRRGWDGYPSDCLSLLG